MPTLDRALPLRAVDGLTLPESVRSALRPGALVPDAAGRLRRLPRWFYEVPSRQIAEDLELAPGFRLRELLETDVREAEALRGWPRYVPCAVTLLAAHLGLLRQRLGTLVYVAANGGYRSPSHAGSRPGSVHAWGTAANVFRVGDDPLDSREAIERCADAAREVLPGAWVRPYGVGPGFADDHLHLDLGFTTVVPHGVAGEPASDEAER